MASLIDFKNPRQRMWGIISSNNLIQLNYGGLTSGTGIPVNSYATNCYNDALEEAKKLLVSGKSVSEVQVVEFVPYDFLMQPNV